MKATFDGACHCGAVRFKAALDPHDAIVCDCSICTRKGSIVVRVPQRDFVLESAIDDLSLYTFNTGVAKHYFCPTCGIHPFHRPRSYPELWAINLRCLDGIDLAAIEPRRVFGSELE